MSEVENVEPQGHVNEPAQPEGATPTSAESVPETAAASEPETGGESATPEGEEGEGKSRYQTRINELTKRNYDQQRVIEETQNRLNQYEQAIAQQQEMSGIEQMPKLSDFNYDEAAYGQAVQQWHVGQMQRQQQMREVAQQRQHQAKAQHDFQVSIQKKLAEGQAKYPDYVATVQDPSVPALGRINPMAMQAVMESDVGVDVGYFLAKNPTEIYGFDGLNPYQTLRKVQELEAKFRRSAAAVNPDTPPPPPNTLKGGKGASQPKDRSKMTTAEWMAWRHKQLQSK